MFGLISSLKYLDGYDREDKEAEDSEVDDDDGMLVVYVPALILCGTIVI